jgi:proline iminopeptidase
LHGGPGGGFESESDSRYFDPNTYRFIGFDQRGAGKSTPTAEIRENTTQDLVADIEKLRKHLGIDKWVVFGGSWGSTLALAYSTSFPERCLGLILRGIFTLRRAELLFFYQEGTSFIFPDYFAEYEAVIPEEERHDMIAAYYRRLTNDDNVEERNRCALAWSKYETATSKLVVDPAYIAKT